MPLLAALRHVSRYSYDAPVMLGPQTVRLRPAPHCRTPVESYSLKVAPADHFINWQQDPWGGWLARLVFSRPTREFVVGVELTARMTPINPFDFFIEPCAEIAPFAYPADLAADLAPFLAVEEAGPALEAAAAKAAPRGARTVDFLVETNRLIAARVRYLVRTEPGVQSPDATLEAASGSCRDSAWLLVQLLRRLGVAARFVSGYLIQLKAEPDFGEGPGGPRCDLTDLHAWAEAYIPGAGWIGLDATSGLVTGEGHIPLACAPHYRACAPISGAVGAAGSRFEVEMSVRRLADDASPAAPLEAGDWSAAMALGEAVDADLRAGDVRLTMGGEPTFVATDAGSAAEWTTDADGPTKPAIARALIHRLKGRFGEGGLLHFGQGKWYPGEALPRWALGLYWRRDGAPIWRGAAEESGGRAPASSGAAAASAFIRRLAGRLGLDASLILPAREDPLHWIKEESGLPPNVVLEGSSIDEAGSRATLARAMAGGLSKVTAQVLPLRRPLDAAEGETWISERWRLRRGRIFLAPGDSPAGMRLPLAGLPRVKPEDYPFITPLDPFAPRGPLPSFDEIHRSPANPAARRSSGRRKKAVVRTALCVEPRDGALCVFMPPIAALEDYLELIAHIEVAAQGLAVRIEGYPPPDDQRMASLKVTPDPGVIEVNVQPAESWRATVAITSGVYEDARAGGLTAEKFALDGAHVGTGGGAHVVVGAASTADSPFLRRPDLIKSVLLYWQAHPALSYLFSGLFVGPTSQAPRIDEARHDSLYELDIALGMIPPPGGGEAPAPWLVDRLLRNLLIDVGGNTHRTEICVDKLYSPQGPAGRLGLVEFRAFEMAPDARMSLVQQLLIRALIAFLWRSPRDGPLVRWGTALHDRFMLPHFLWADFLAVLADLERAGYGFESRWFEAQRAFRFPILGAVEAAGVGLELRRALEPWHVIGEETTELGTARMVDSSVERLQVLASGFNPERFAVACNGRALPMTPTGVSMQVVAGVRYKAWKLRSGLHPTLPVDSPLTFDIVELGSGRSLGGCVYHVVHPGGRSYDTAPVNAREAQARRAARFEPHGRGGGIVRPMKDLAAGEFPLTLDLRRTGGA